MTQKTKRDSINLVRRWTISTVIACSIAAVIFFVVGFIVTVVFWQTYITIALYLQLIAIIAPAGFAYGAIQRYSMSRIDFRLPDYWLLGTTLGFVSGTLVWMVVIAITGMSILPMMPFIALGFGIGQALLFRQHPSFAITWALLPLAVSTIIILARATINPLIYGLVFVLYAYASARLLSAYTKRYPSSRQI